MRRHRWKWLIKTLILGILVIPVVIKLPLITLRKYKHLVQLSQNPVQKQHVKKDWHNWQLMYTDCQRTGIGEQGKAAVLDNDTDQVLEEKMFRQHGLNALLSEAISVNRSLTDIRDPRCRHKKYLTDLPTVSIVIPFHHEHLMTFARTLHSLINRTPPELLKEIILVDDFSDIEFFAKLEKYVGAHLDKVHFVRMPERVGLIRARLAGARKASAEVLVILDAHIEVQYNWLPPLLEPIKLNKRTVTCPRIDAINQKYLDYSYVGEYQGGFDWSLLFIQTLVLPKDFVDNAEPYRNPVMMGGLFAMRVDYFWELGGYDEGLDIWGAEQYELSFKIWMCGGQLLNVPCSRVGHHFRGSLNKGINAKSKQYLVKNNKRIADVWMDEYSKYVYRNYDGTLETVDAGDITKQKALRKSLNCKPFSWFMNEIAVNILQEYSPFEYAFGAIQSVASPNLCVDTLSTTSPGLYPCASNLTNPNYNQLFTLTNKRDLRRRRSGDCLDVPKYYKNAPVILYYCHKKVASQLWYYDRTNKWLVNGLNGSYCLEALLSNRTLYMNICQKDNLNMKWNFGAVNNTALDTFFENNKI